MLCTLATTQWQRCQTVLLQRTDQAYKITASASCTLSMNVVWSAARVCVCVCVCVANWRYEKVKNKKIKKFSKAAGNVLRVLWQGRARCAGEGVGVARTEIVQQNLNLSEIVFGDSLHPPFCTPPMLPSSPLWLRACLVRASDLVRLPQRQRQRQQQLAACASYKLHVCCMPPPLPLSIPSTPL